MKRLVVAVVGFYVLVFVLSSTAQPQDGKHIFRFDTFGDEQLWTDTLQLHKAVASVSPKAALSVGLKVDAEALSPALIDALKTGVNDPAVTLQLLAANAVVGVIGQISNGALVSVGI